MRRWDLKLPLALWVPLSLALGLGLGAASAQPTAPDFERFRTRIDDAVQALGNNSRMKGLPVQERQQLAEFVSGNMLFVLLHELAHAAIGELDLPVLGKEEDAADSFASLTLIHIKSEFSDRVLTEAAKGWFLSDKRDRKTGEPEIYFDEHGLNQQRAFQIVCYMVGADLVRFKALADETKLPEDRRESCKHDYEKAAKSWGMVLAPHVRHDDQPETKIDVIYGPGKGSLAMTEQISRAIRLLEPVAAQSSKLVAWPMPFSLEMQSCGFINARWSRDNHKLELCYELAQDFAELYRDFGFDRPKSRGHKTAKKG